MATSGNPVTNQVSARASEIISFLAQPLGIIPEILRLKSENTRLREANTLLMLQKNFAEEAIRENQRLRSLLGFRNQSQLEIIASEIIASNPMPGVHSILINVGIDKGVKKHMAVINDQGLVGKLAQVSQNTAIVQALLDRNLGAAVRLANCRVDGITSWGGGNHLFIEGIPSSAPVRLGEPVLTSGLDGVFPEGIPVGKVISTEQTKESLFLKVEVTPVVDFSRLEEVFVVIGENNLELAP